MSKATSADAPEPTDEDRDLDWLERNADELDPTEHMDTEAWERAREGRQDADVEDLSTDDLYRVELPDGDTHLSLFVTHSEDRHAAACSCDGYQYHGYCAHLLVLAQRDALENILASDDERAESLLESDGVVAEVVDHATGDPDDDVEDDVDVDQEESRDDPLDLPSNVKQMSSVDDGDLLRCLTCGRTGDHLADLEHMSDCPHDEDDLEDGEVSTTEVLDEVEGAHPDVVDQDSTDQPPESTDEDTTPATPSDPFAKELAEDVPERYVMELRGEPYIRRAGYAALARDAGLRIQIYAVESASETGFEYARYEAMVNDQDGVTLAKDVGTARLETEDLEGAEGELDELAATRAARRALEWATGAGNTL
jgi:hypothetical protein